MKHIRSFATLQEAIGSVVDIPALVYIEDIEQTIFLDETDDIGLDGRESIKTEKAQKYILNLNSDNELVLDYMENPGLTIEDDAISIDLQTGSLLIDENLNDILNLEINTLSGGLITNIDNE